MNNKMKDATTKAGVRGIKRLLPIITVIESDEFNRADRAAFRKKVNPSLWELSDKLRALLSEDHRALRRNDTQEIQRIEKIGQQILDSSFGRAYSRAFKAAALKRIPDGEDPAGHSDQGTDNPIPTSKPGTHDI